LLTLFSSLKALVSFPSKNLTFYSDDYNYAPFSPFSITNASLIEFVPTSGCNFQPRLGNAEGTQSVLKLLNSKFTKTTPVVVVTLLQSSWKHDCYTTTEALERVKVAYENMAKGQSNIPASLSALIAVWFPAEIRSTVRYASVFMPSFDGIPSMNCTFLFIDYWNTAVTSLGLNATRNATKNWLNVKVDIEQQQNVRNALWSSLTMKIIRWTFCAINALLDCYGLYILFKTLTRMIFFDLRMAVFITALIAGIANAIVIPSRPNMFYSSLLLFLMTFLFELAFYLLMYLWAVVLVACRLTYRFRFYQAGVGIAITLAVVKLFVNMMILFQIGLPNVIDQILFWMFGIADLVIALAFGWEALRIWKLKNSGELDQKSVKALEMIEVLAQIALLTFIPIAILNISFFYLSHTPLQDTIIGVVKVLYSTINLAALLLVLGVKIPSS